MDISLDIDRAERRLKSAEITINDFCKSGGLDKATWWRWKTGRVKPLLETWQKAMAHLDEIAPPDSGHS